MIFSFLVFAAGLQPVGVYHSVADMEDLGEHIKALKDSRFIPSDIHSRESIRFQFIDKLYENGYLEAAYYEWEDFRHTLAEPDKKLLSRKTSALLDKIGNYHEEAIGKHQGVNLHLLEKLVNIGEVTYPTGPKGHIDFAMPNDFRSVDADWRFQGQLGKVYSLLYYYIVKGDQ